MIVTREQLKIIKYNFSKLMKYNMPTKIINKTMPKIKIFIKRYLKHIKQLIQLMMKIIFSSY